MERSGLAGIFLRSLFVQSSFNFWRMQNLGFVFSLVPLIRHLERGGRNIPEFLGKHLQMFNTHPYFSGPLIGSVVMMEEGIADNNGKPADDTAAVKQSLMGPYAALGDSFFWGSLRPFSAIVGVTAAVAGSPIAPAAFFFLYNPSHLWVRCAGFIAGYRRGRLGVEFVRGLDLLTTAKRLRWASLAVLGVLAGIASQQACGVVAGPDILIKTFLLALILLLYFAMKRGISQIKLLYGLALVLFIVSFM
jgi:mannose/fructose/N-acetylgalactosamine-specific phosphotransferase system component IID